MPCPILDAPGFFHFLLGQTKVWDEPGWQNKRERHEKEWKGLKGLGNKGFACFCVLYTGLGLSKRIPSGISSIQKSQKLFVCSWWFPRDLGKSQKISWIGNSSDALATILQSFAWTDNMRLGRRFIQGFLLALFQADSVCLLWSYFSYYFYVLRCVGFLFTFCLTVYCILFWSIAASSSMFWRILKIYKLFGPQWHQHPYKPRIGETSFL